MNKVFASTTRILFWLALMLALVACTINRINVGPTQTTTETVEREDAESVDVKVAMGFGELTIGGGAADLAQADFDFNIDDWEPGVSYAVSGGQGTLEITQPDTTEDLGIPDDDIVYRWDLAFNNDVPMAMEIELGAGEGNLSLGTLNLTSLSVEAGAGDMAIDLRNGRVPDLNVAMGAGEVTLDLGGDWSQDLDAFVSGGVGKLTLILPRDTGARVTATGGLGEINVEGLTADGDAYVNDAFGESDVTLTITVEGGVGEIVLQLEE
jgi:hypothetical protein